MSYLNESTTLVCSWDTSLASNAMILLFWRFHVGVSQEFKRLASAKWLPGVTGQVQSVTDVKYRNKVSSSFDEPKMEFCLTIKTTSLDDDKENTEWQCLLYLPVTEYVNQTIEVRGEVMFIIPLHEINIIICCIKFVHISFHLFSSLNLF